MMTADVVKLLFALGTVFIVTYTTARQFFGLLQETQDQLFESLDENTELKRENMRLRHEMQEAETQRVIKDMQEKLRKAKGE